MAEIFPTGVVAPAKLARCMKSGQSHHPVPATRLIA